MNVLIIAWVSVLVVIVPVFLILKYSNQIEKWIAINIHPWIKKHFDKK